MAGVASALIVLVTILKLGPLFQELPKVFVSLFLLLFPTKGTTVKLTVYVISFFFVSLICTSTELIKSFTMCVFQAVLSSIVFVNLKGMFKQHSDMVTLWKSSKTDLVRGQTTPAGLNRDQSHYSWRSVLPRWCGSSLGCRPCSSTWIWVWRHRSFLLCLLSSSEPKRETAV